MSALGQKQTFTHLRPMSALPPKADMDGDLQFRFAIATLRTSTPRQPSRRIEPISHHADGTSAATIPASATTAMIASASAPSSTNNLTSSRNGAVQFIMTGLFVTRLL